ncbi:MAG: homoserine dehydrogenase [Synergistaceae bacterium]|jgi:homoserine dehydrogenase|nr:homoserine dehydrogenase [Synergistaceae bacterium]
MKNIALIGYGVVGHGVADLLSKNADIIAKRAGDQIRLKHILTARPRADDPRQELLTQNADDIFGDCGVSVVVECINDLDAAYRYCRRSLSAGKHYVTSNKNLIATYGVELTELAARNSVALMFEASVAAGIPVLRPLCKCLSSNRVTGVMGIVNGTTNYILTQMKREGRAFDDALRDAQRLGYAETDPSADVLGFDACRKLAILLSIAFDRYVRYKEIPAEGITAVTSADITLAERLGYSMKLIAMGRLTPSDRIYARVSPLLIPHDHLLASVDDVFNAVAVSADTAGDVLFYGRGAGAEPSASSIVGDVIDIVTSGRYNDPVWREDYRPLLPADENVGPLFVRASLPEREKLLQLFPEGIAAAEGENLGFITTPGLERKLREDIQAAGIETGAIWRVFSRAEDDA